MKLVMFCHPPFLNSQSMPRFAAMLKSAYESRGYEVEMWSPRPNVYNWLSNTRFAKWAGYIDQYLIFPAWARKAIKRTSADTLFVFCDQALGPWIPLVKDRPHVVHVHDFIALRSALGDLKENATPITGRIYQRYIRRGFKQARHFISVSKKTRDDLHRFGEVSAKTSECVYNALNYPYAQMSRKDASDVLRNAKLPVPTDGMLLHVSGGQWYKNLPGVVSIYAQYAKQTSEPLPLWCISPKPNAAVSAALKQVPANGRVLFFSNLENLTLQAAYSYARVLLFPSLAEGFGWPIVEARACGCPVVTSDEAPMNEIAGDGVHYIPRLHLEDDRNTWAAKSALLLHDLISWQSIDPERQTDSAHNWAKRFDAGRTIDTYLSIYERVFRASLHDVPLDAA
jgi:glycosyltransferase involved in cell wall biosynthesis